jgi:NitT/TauT family transport system ATP-binding protein
VVSIIFGAQDAAVDYSVDEWGRLPALGPVSFQIEAGQFVCLVGPSGCGKSTLVRLLAGLQAPSAGLVTINNEPITQPSAQVGLMSQEANLMPWRSVIENIALPLELAGLSSSERGQAVNSILPQLGLEEFGNAFPGELSGGMAQRVALGRVLVASPDALLLDEPFGALDAMTRERMGMDLLDLWSDLRPTVLMVTHSISEAVLLADRILILSPRPGRLIADLRVDLPRPRQISDIHSLRFGELARQVRERIQQS